MCVLFSLIKMPLIVFTCNLFNSKHLLIFFFGGGEGGGVIFSAMRSVFAYMCVQTYLFVYIYTSIFLLFTIKTFKNLLRYETKEVWYY